ncbi:MAG: hypothetical protein JHC33_12740 [Ignisphaera sp.]|nr:hypothetical protein [Ignisphaera sp.]
MATAYKSIYADNGSISIDVITIDVDNVACIFTEKPIYTDADNKSRSIPTSNLSNYRYFNYSQGNYYSTTKTQINTSTDSTLDYKYSRLLAKILDIAFTNNNLDVLSDDQLKLVSRLINASHNIFSMPLDIRRLDQFLSEFREYSISDKTSPVVDFPIIIDSLNSTDNTVVSTANGSTASVSSSNSNTGNLFNYTATNIAVAPNQTHPIFITSSDPFLYMVYNLRVTPSNTQAYYTVSVYNGDASQSSVLSDKTNLYYLSANNLGELSDNTPFVINGASNIKSIVITNNSNVNTTFSITLTAAKYNAATEITSLVI